jgi:hypothetical protein
MLAMTGRPTWPREPLSHHRRWPACTTGQKDIGLPPLFEEPLLPNHPDRDFLQVFHAVVEGSWPAGMPLYALVIGFLSATGLPPVSCVSTVVRSEPDDVRLHVSAAVWRGCHRDPRDAEVLTVISLT